MQTKSSKTLNRTFSVAPMMDWTDRHARYFLRLISKHCLLYTEMVTTGAIIHGDHHRFLAFNAEEHPLAVQLGGSNPAELAECAKIAEKWGYDEVNLNVGCPSDRVQNGRIGACLMAEPGTVADCIKAMQDVCNIPVTVKHRIGINSRESFEELTEFVATIADTGCNTFIVHARIAVLEGLSPKENREIPPLKYDWVYQLKSLFPQLNIIINGGINSLDQVQEHLTHVDGVMVGRAAYQTPYLLADVDRLLYQDSAPALTRHQVIDKLIPYIEQQMAKGAQLHHLTRHILGLFQGLPGARLFRRHLSENTHKPGASIDVLKTALTKCPDFSLA
ncbi:tRNA dihydrouridine(20/20a) synthase DusA [Endozoicomonas sp. SM1973]|uniref:tRNA-dihydrouridine(20/20a) synthase n=1 Tax=Spartinivicinus marinus TaxID=2994442 RepID=A0A853I735_9GAMM|nr:tRNA dihydrouridine(20/20a) synthase DusA [Spartinivicinus marinus]MCX4029039.1 tRNA dihydrouridine(20/20a) synthase DusA [Spartinivicinus marinus]NYZ65377.1 tRNA dihydrouridine(20/20a) synthase DusA [Spartinivicinus marinus]